jgi:DNA-binding NarL/FixJ family response regulator
MMTRFRQRYARESAWQFNMTPLIDVTFLLLTYFMLASHFASAEKPDMKLPRPDDSQASLSDQEQKILLLIAEGKTNKEIAEEIFLSDKTVKNYVSSILSKLNLRRRAEAAAFIARKGLGRHEEDKEA